MGRGGGAGIIGGNGAGKTTLFRMMLGTEQPDSGSITLGSTVVPMYAEQVAPVHTAAAQPPPPQTASTLCLHPLPTR